MIEELLHEKMRKQVWLTAWAATASAITCPTTEAATKWADAALKDFDIRFPKPDTKTN